MSAQPAPAETADASWAHDLARALIEPQLKVLEELAGIGLGLARNLGRQAAGTPEDGETPVAGGDLVLAFERVSRAVRFTLALQSKLIADLRALEDGALCHPPGPAAARKLAVQHIVGNVVRSTMAGSAIQATVIERFRPEIAERLDDETLYGDLLTRPLSELVADICRDLGLQPDWPGLSRELWAQAEIDGGKVGWPLRNLAAGARPRPPPPDRVARAARRILAAHGA